MTSSIHRSGPGSTRTRAALRTVPCLTTLLLALGAFSCSSSSEASLSLATYIENAESYFRQQDNLRCEDQVDRGLELQPSNYKLNLLKGEVLLRRAHRNPELYSEALEQMRKVYDLRSVRNHDYSALLALGNAHLGLAHYNRRLALEARERAQAPDIDANERQQLLARASEHDRVWTQHVHDAERQYETVIESGDGVHAAKRFLYQAESMKLKGLEGAERAQQLRRAIEVTKDYLESVRQRLDFYSKQRANTTDLTLEAESDKRRSFFRQQLFDALGQLALLNYKLENFAAAIEYNDELIERRPNEASTYFNRGKCHHRLRHWQDAARDFQDFLRMTGEEQGQRRDEATALLEESLAKMRSLRERR